ncbi:MAG: hypothetical protein PUB69_04460 [Desulfovibrionaceae bacterium]|nr:hypothetical protein [Desulfovibrionaceae bacterium]
MRRGMILIFAVLISAVGFSVSDVWADAWGDPRTGIYHTRGCPFSRNAHVHFKKEKDARAHGFRSQCTECRRIEKWEAERRRRQKWDREHGYGHARDWDHRPSHRSRHWDD